MAYITYKIMYASWTKRDWPMVMHFIGFIELWQCHQTNFPPNFNNVKFLSWWITYLNIQCSSFIIPNNYHFGLLHKANLLFPLMNAKLNTYFYILPLMYKDMFVPDKVEHLCAIMVLVIVFILKSMLLHNN